MSLSLKEAEVLTLVALGYCDKQIGYRLNITYGTVRSHIDKIILKLNARNRAHAVIIYKMLYPEWLEDFYEKDNNTLDGRQLPSD